MLAPAGAERKGPKTPFPLVGFEGIQPVICKRVPAGAYTCSYTARHPLPSGLMFVHEGMLACIDTHVWMLACIDTHVQVISDLAVCYRSPIS